MADRVKQAEKEKEKLDNKPRFLDSINYPEEVYVYNYGKENIVHEKNNFIITDVHPGKGQYIDMGDMTFDLKEIKIQCADGVDAWLDIKLTAQPALHTDMIDDINDIKAKLKDLLDRNADFLGTDTLDIDVIKSIKKTTRRSSLGHYSAKYINSQSQLVNEFNMISLNNEEKSGIVATVVNATLQKYLSSLPDDIAKHINTYSSVKKYCEKHAIDEDTTKFYLDLDKIIEYTVRIKLLEKYGLYVKEYGYGLPHGDLSQEKVETDIKTAEMRSKLIAQEGKNKLDEQDFENQKNISEKTANVTIQKMQSDQDAYDIKAKGEAEASVIEQKLSVTDGRTEGEIDASLNNSNRPQKTIIEAGSVTKSINDTIDHTSEEVNKLIGLINHTKENARKMDSEAEKTTDEELFNDKTDEHDFREYVEEPVTSTEAEKTTDEELFNDKTDEHDLREYVEEPVTSTEEDKFERIKNEVVDEYIKNMNSKINSVPEESYDDSSLISEVSELPDEEETNTKDEGISYTKK